MAAAPQAPTALAYPTQGSSDPFSAAFYENQAKLQFSEENILAASQDAQKKANASYEYNRSINARQVPIALRRNQNAANSQGLAESGQLARTQGETQTNFAQKATRLSEARKSAVERAQNAERVAKGDYALGTNSNVRSEEERQLANQLQNPSSPIGATPANPGGLRTVTGPPEAGGVVPYTETSSRGSVAVGSATRAARERAAKKATVG